MSDKRAMNLNKLAKIAPTLTVLEVKVDGKDVLLKIEQLHLFHFF
jgi:hypothetical protein